MTKNILMCPIHKTKLRIISEHVAICPEKGCFWDEDIY